MKYMKERKRNKSAAKHSRRLPVLLALVVCSFVLIVPVLAKYVSQRVTDVGQVLAEKFYFTADLIGDTTMAQSEESYGFGSDALKGDWYLYGGSTHRITVKVQNFYDDLRITKGNTKYTVTLDDTGKEKGVTVRKEDSSGVKQDVEGQTLTMTGSAVVTDALILEIPSYNIWKYEEDTIVTLKVSSISPYKKTMEMRFHLCTTDTTMKYKVTDTVGSPYAELVIMSNVVDDFGDSTEVAPWICWGNGLEIDNTNNLTYTYVAPDQFHPQSGIADRLMPTSEAFQTGRSESIVFFKKDTNKDYSKPVTLVQPAADGKYILQVGIEDISE